MKIGKGDLRSQRQRRRDRYRGCPVCGVRGAQCTACGLGAQIVAVYRYASLSHRPLMLDRADGRGKFPSPKMQGSELIFLGVFVAVLWPVLAGAMIFDRGVKP